MDIIEFTVKSKENDDVQISGYTYDEYLDDYEPLEFYDTFGFHSGSRVPKNPYYNEESLEHKEYELIASEFQSDALFLQFLSDFAYEKKIIDRGSYLLIINE